MVLQQRTHTILAAILGAIALGLMLFMLYIQVTSYQAARQAIKEEQAAIKQAEARLTELERLEHQAEELREREANLNRLIPAGPEEDRLIEEIQEIADNAGARFLRIHFKEPVPDEEYTAMPLEIVFVARYHDLLRVLAALKQGPRAVRLEEIKVSRGSGGFAELKADLNATVFYRTQDSGKRGYQRESKGGQQVM